MLILGVDTSGKDGSIALVEFEQGNSRTLERVPLQGGTFSAQLVPQISELLQRHRVGKGDIDAFAVASGPGSFTGLRVGLAAIKALAEVLQKPIAAVPLLEAVAGSSGTDGNVLAALDAGRGEVFVAGVYTSGTRATIRDQQLLTSAEFIALSSTWQIVTPDAKIAELAREHGLRVEQIDQRPLAQLIFFVECGDGFSGGIELPHQIGDAGAGDGSRRPSLVNRFQRIALQFGVRHRRLGGALSHFRAPPDVLSAPENIPGHHHPAAIVLVGNSVDIGVRIVVSGGTTFERQRRNKRAIGHPEGVFCGVGI